MHRVSSVAAATPSPSGGAYAAVQASEASLDAVLSQFNARQKKGKKVPPPQATAAAVQPSKAQQQPAPGGGSGKGKQQQQQQAGRGTAASASSGGGPPAPPNERSNVQQPIKELDRNSLDVGKLVREVEASVKRKEQRRRPEEDAVEEADATPQAHAPHAPAFSGKTKNSRYGPSTNTPRGFGAPPAPASIAAGIRAADAAASAHDRSAAGSGAASTSAPSTSSSRGSSAPSSKAPLRVFLYGTDEATALAAVADAGLGTRVVLTADPRGCDCVLSAKLTRTGRAIKHPQGERTAANAKVPFINVGRHMTGPNLKAALHSLLSPGTTPATADTSRREMTREAAAAAVNAARITGNYFPAPQPSHLTGGRV
ncbi:hypothetical protein FOA52_001508 [Chlamydomonas sp. UWO 241]|nr:hypothetical protein FOA52_001508 [Chlamydomonas sp. UWO 241]